LNSNGEVLVWDFINEKSILIERKNIFWKKNMNLKVFHNKIIYFEDGLYNFLEKKCEESLKYFEPKNNYGSLLRRSREMIFLFPETFGEIRPEYEKYDFILKRLVLMTVAFDFLVNKYDEREFFDNIFNIFIKKFSNEEFLNEIDENFFIILFSSLGKDVFELGKNFFSGNFLDKNEMSNYKTYEYNTTDFPLSNKRTEVVFYKNEKLMLLPLSPSKLIVLLNRNSGIYDKDLDVDFLKKEYIKKAANRYKNQKIKESKKDNLIIFNNRNDIKKYEECLKTKSNIFNYTFDGYYEIIDFKNKIKIENVYYLSFDKEINNSSINKFKCALNIDGVFYYIDAEMRDNENFSYSVYGESDFNNKIDSCVLNAYDIYKIIFILNINEDNLIKYIKNINEYQKLILKNLFYDKNFSNFSNNDLSSNDFKEMTKKGIVKKHKKKYQLNNYVRGIFKKNKGLVKLLES
jgi:hypothetical protein